MANKISSYESNGWMAVATYQNLEKGDRHLFLIKYH